LARRDCPGDNSSVENDWLPWSSSQNGLTSLCRESVGFYAVLFDFSSRDRVHNGDAWVCRSRRDHGIGYEGRLRRFDPPFCLFISEAETGALMNQLAEELPKVETAKLDPAVQAFLKAEARKGGPGINEVSVEDARAGLLQMQAAYIAKSPVDVDERTILVGPRGNTAIRIVRPKARTATLPAVVYFHGGGWVLGDAETHDRLIREIAHGANAAVIFVEYTRSPEARFPVAIEEGYAVTKWVFETGRMINVDPSRIAVAGDSAGGNIAAAVTLLARERNGPELRFQALFYPVTDASFDTQSYEKFSHGYFLTREAMKWFWNHYAQNTATRDRPTASPLRASVEELRNLPPALIITAECDVLRDEGEAYAAKLRQADVPVIATRYPGMIHDFMMLNALSGTAGARAAINEANETLRAAFLRS
jgi:acetyl esterase